MHRLLLIAPLLLSLAGVSCTERSRETTAAQDVRDNAAEGTSSETWIAEGQLTRIDKDKDMVWLKKADGEEMQFSFTMTTDVEGAGEEVEGLVDDVESLTPGSNLRIHYRPGRDEDVVGDDEVNTAVKIEVTGKSAAAL
jgi:hypothetical protein